MAERRQINWENVGNFANALLSTCGQTFSSVGQTVAQFQNNQNAQQNGGRVNTNYQTSLSINPLWIVGGVVAVVASVLLIKKL